MWPDERVAKLVSGTFIPARVHVRDQAEDFKRMGERFGVQWTPTTLLIDPAGVERYRIEGFLPLEDFQAQLLLGLGHMAFQAERWDEAEKRFQEVVDRFPKSDAAAEALYWAGVSRYKRSHDAAALAETAKAFQSRYTDSTWAKKSSVWK